MTKENAPRVWLDLDQAALDAAYDQSVYAPNMEQILDRCRMNSERVRRRLGAPRRHAYGAAPIEKLDVYPTGKAGAPVLVFIHGGIQVRRLTLPMSEAYPTQRIRIRNSCRVCWASSARAGKRI